MKICPKCKMMLPLHLFHKDSAKKSGLRSYCKQCVSKRQKQWHIENYDKIKERRKLWPSRTTEHTRKKRQELKAELITHYGNGKCVCCGETEIMFLSIDHTNGDGCKHLKHIGYNLYFWLKKNNYPEGFQVLCFNCNRGKYLNNGICPHQSQHL